MESYTEIALCGYLHLVDRRKSGAARGTFAASQRLLDRGVLNKHRPLSIRARLSRPQGRTKEKSF